MNCPGYEGGHYLENSAGKDIGILHDILAL